MFQEGKCVASVFYIVYVMFFLCCRSEGQKFNKAREWKLPIVNIQFLNELLLGNFSCLQMIHSPKYQHFTLEQPFRFDINIAPHLMGNIFFSRPKPKALSK